MSIRSAIGAVKVGLCLHDNSLRRISRNATKEPSLQYTTYSPRLIINDPPADRFAKFRAKEYLFEFRSRAGKQVDGDRRDAADGDRHLALMQRLFR